MRLIYNRMEATIDFIAEGLILSSHLLVWIWTTSLYLLEQIQLGPEYKVPWHGLLSFVCHSDKERAESRCHKLCV